MHQLTKSIVKNMIIMPLGCTSFTTSTVKNTISMPLGCTSFTTSTVKSTIILPLGYASFTSCFHKHCEEHDHLAVGARQLHHDLLHPQVPAEHRHLRAQLPGTRGKAGAGAKEHDGCEKTVNEIVSGLLWRLSVQA